MSYKNVFFYVLVLSLMLRVCSLYSAKKDISEKFELVVKNETIVIAASSLQKIPVYLKNKSKKQKFKIEVSVETNENIEVEKKNISKILENDLSLDIEFRVAPSIKPGIYTLKINVKSSNFSQNKIIYLSLPFFVQKTLSPPAISESYCKPCYWGGKMYTTFGKDANVVTLYPLWDDKNLYFGINIRDKDIHGLPDKNNPDKDDNIQIFISTENGTLFKRKNIIYRYILSAANKMSSEKITKDKNKNIKENFQSSAEMVSHIYGTLNNNFDVDQNWWCIVKIPFSDFNINAQEGLKLKINVINFDKKSTDINLVDMLSWSSIIMENTLYNTNMYPELVLSK